MDERQCAALRSNRAPVVAEVIGPDGTMASIRDRRRDGESGPT
jgi:hypothetical protein